MLTRRTLIFGAVCLAVAGPAIAADPSAAAFVTAIYSSYKGKDVKGAPLDNAAPREPSSTASRSFRDKIAGCPRARLSSCPS